MEHTVAQLMTPEPITTTPGATVGEVREVMEQGGIRHLPVVADGLLVGLVSQRDVLSCTDDGTLVADVMVTDLKTVSPKTAAYEAAYLLLSQVIGSVPVVDDQGQLVGIVTDTDFVRAAYVLLGGRVPVEDLLSEEHEKV